MAEQEAVLESAADQAVQNKAEKMGWIPPSRYKGDPDRYIDADAYIERGETVLPIVKEQNKRLQADLQTLRAESARTAAALKAAQNAIEQIEERHSVATQKAVENAREELKTQLVVASETGDHVGVAELTDKLTQLKVAESAPPGQPKQQAPAPFVPTPELAEWNKENPWFGTDRRKTSLALGIAQELREGGEKSIGRDFFDIVKAEVDKTYPVKEEPIRASKVEGGRNGSEVESRASGKRTFSSLPADAKAACDADARQFVGPTKRYKTKEEWRSRYAELYFEGA